MKSLIVDDDSISRKMLRKIIAKYGHTDIATDGEDALISFKQSIDENDRYDLITLDIHMPSISGQEVLKKIRKIEEDNKIFGLDQTKIIMVTVEEDVAQVISAFRSGCESYITKPLNDKQIEKKLKELFGDNFFNNKAL